MEEKDRHKSEIHTIEISCSLKVFLENTDNRIDDFNQFKELMSVIAMEEKEFFYRGQADSEWEINSSYIRENDVIKSKEWKKAFPLSEFKEILEEAKKNYKQKSTLNLIAEMQHIGMGTILIDITPDINNALWFAFSEPINFNEEKNYRALFVLEKNKNEEIKNEIKEEDIKLLKEVEIKNTIYSCPTSIKRGVSQKSYFIMDNQDWNIKMIKIEICDSIREKILDYLKNRGVTAKSIFPDLEGIKIERQRKNCFANFMKWGLRAQIENKFNASLKWYEKSIEEINNRNGNKDLMESACISKCSLLDELGKYEDNIVFCNDILKKGYVFFLLLVFKYNALVNLLLKTEVKIHFKKDKEKLNEAKKILGVTEEIIKNNNFNENEKGVRKLLENAEKIINYFNKNK